VRGSRNTWSIDATLPSVNAEQPLDEPISWLPVGHHGSLFVLGSQ
jgi:hypothetical protein